MRISILTVCYLIASVTFILGLKMLSNPVTARKGNLIAAGGMILAILGSIFLYEENGQRLHNYGWIFGGIFIGGVIATLTARKVKMAAMPELVSLFNGMGGACAVLISIVEFGRLVRKPIIEGGWTSYPPLSSLGDLSEPNISITVPRGELLIILLGLIIGSVSFAGSVIAWGKLNGRIKDIVLKGQHLMNFFSLLLLITGAAYLIFSISFRFSVGIYPFRLDFETKSWVTPFFYSMLALALLYGVLFVLPIGGADVAVVISLLNSFTGVAAACGGILYDNKAMLTGGILVGAAGTLLTIRMCKAMNRSLQNVLIGSFGGRVVAAKDGAPGGAGKDQEGL